jgi:hypothetical protein
MHKTLPFGSIASNLETPAQTLVVCLAVLTDVNPSLAAIYRERAVVKLVESNQPLTLVARHQVKRAVAAVLTDLNRHCPLYTYVGYRPNDLSNLGVWIDLDALHQAERSGKLTQVYDTIWKGVISPYVLEITDKGLTLYRRRGRQAIWSVS